MRFYKKKTQLLNSIHAKYKGIQRTMKRKKYFPDGSKKVMNLLAALYTMRLLVNSHLWKLMSTSGVEELAESMEEVQEVIYQCNQLTKKYIIRQGKYNHIRSVQEIQETRTFGNLFETRDFFYRHVELPENFALRFAKLTDQESEAFDIEGFLKRILDDLEMRAKETSELMPQAFTKNLDVVSEIFGLDSLDREIFTFLVLLKTDNNLQTVANTIDYSDNTFSLLSELISRAIQADVEKVSQSISGEGNLLKTRLIKLGLSMREDVETHFQFSPDNLLDDFLSRTLTKEELQNKFMRPAEKPKLGLVDFKHIPEVEGQLIPAITDAVKRRRVGCNILLYGKTGTGKTELTRTVAEYLGMKLFSVGSDEKTDNRLSCLNSADMFLALDTDSLLVIDECDDVFNTGVSFLFKPVRTNKGKIIETLEGNRRPVFWTCNSIANVDEAILRRFDIILEMPKLNADIRKKMIRKNLGAKFSKEFVSALAMNDSVNLAMLNKALEISRTLGKKTQKKKEEDMVRLLNQTLKAQGCPLIGVTYTKEMPYDVSCANTEVDLAKLCENLKTVDQARICLYGAPGTGKSAYVRWVANEIGRPLLVKKASDLLNCCLGGTEKNIARLFAEAREQKAVLLLDEADSFLRDRSKAWRSWEVTQVNELLTQVENFEGFFFATTNLMDDVDEAALRRFDLKAEFKWLKDGQKENLLKLYGKNMGIKGDPSEEALRRLAAMDALSPGDFACIASRNRFSTVTSYEDFVSRLFEECKLKRTAKQTQPIGFG